MSSRLHAAGIRIALVGTRPALVRRLSPETYLVDVCALEDINIVLCGWVREVGQRAVTVRFEHGYSDLNGLEAYHDLYRLAVRERDD